MEKFDYDVVSSKMASLNEVFGTFMTKLTDIDAKIDENFNSGEASALFGLLGTSYLKSWDYVSPNFVKFKEHFDALYNLVGEVSKNNEGLEEDAAALAAVNDFYGVDGE